MAANSGSNLPDYVALLQSYINTFISQQHPLSDKNMYNIDILTQFFARISDVIDDFYTGDSPDDDDRERLSEPEEIDELFEQFYTVFRQYASDRASLSLLEQYSAKSRRAAVQWARAAVEEVEEELRKCHTDLSEYLKWAASRSLSKEDIAATRDRAENKVDALTARILVAQQALQAAEEDFAHIEQHCVYKVFDDPPIEISSDEASTPPPKRARTTASGTAVRKRAIAQPFIKWEGKCDKCESGRKDCVPSPEDSRQPMRCSESGNQVLALFNTQGFSWPTTPNFGNHIEEAEEAVRAVGAITRKFEFVDEAAYMTHLAKFEPPYSAPTKFATKSQSSKLRSKTVPPPAAQSSSSLGRCLTQPPAPSAPSVSPSISTKPGRSEAQLPQQARKRQREQDSSSTSPITHLSTTHSDYRADSGQQLLTSSGAPLSIVRTTSADSAGSAGRHLARLAIGSHHSTSASGSGSASPLLANSGAPSPSLQSANVPFSTYVLDRRLTAVRDQRNRAVSEIAQRYELISLLDRQEAEMTGLPVGEYISSDPQIVIPPVLPLPRSTDAESITTSKPELSKAVTESK
ncbi:hypothetical protein C8Q76DRAFT_789688 [Earliella scabrosa]|nr:hypothetical protein C8Q76DRAFT_789688 [Earliella scabrosa]